MMNFWSWTMRASGYPLAAAMREHARVDSLTADERATRLEGLRARCVRHHAMTTSAYRDLVDPLPRSPFAWEQLPVLTKSFFQEHEEGIVSSEMRGRPLFRNSTSGSSGLPLRFAKDKWAHAMTWAQIVSNYGKLGLRHGQSLQARFYGMPQGSRNARRKERFKDYLAGRFRFSAHAQSDEDLRGIAESFRIRPFTYAYGYSSMLAVFARYLENRSLRLKDLCPTLRCIIYTSEVCPPSDIRLIESSFGVPLYCEYGASELSVLAFGRANHELPLNQSDLHIEVLDEDGATVPEGTSGRIVATALYNMAMPFIRFDTGDRGAIRIRDGEAYLEQLNGRAADLIRLPGGEQIPAMTIYTSTKEVSRSWPAIREFYVRQPSLDRLDFEVVSDEPLTQTIADKFKRVTQAYVGDGVSVGVRQVEEIARRDSGKLRFFESSVPKEP